MKRCAYCGRENTDEATNCVEYGTPDLRAENSPAALAQAERTARDQSVPAWLLEKTRIPSPEEMDQDFVTLIKCRTLPEADLIVSELQGIGIEAFIPDESLMQNFSLPGVFGYVRVQVAPKDYEVARELLSAKEETPPDGPPIRESPPQS